MNILSLLNFKHEPWKTFLHLLQQSNGWWKYKNLSQIAQRLRFEGMEMSEVVSFMVSLSWAIRHFAKTENIETLTGARVCRGGNWGEVRNTKQTHWVNTQNKFTRDKISYIFHQIKGVHYRSRAAILIQTKHNVAVYSINPTRVQGVLVYSLLNLS